MDNVELTDIEKRVLQIMFDQFGVLLNGGVYIDLGEDYFGRDQLFNLALKLKIKE